MFSLPEHHKHPAHRIMNYGSIKLVPCQRRDSVYPYTREEYADKWHVPGRKILSTDALVRLGTSRGILVTMSESSRDGRMTTRLN